MKKLVLAATAVALVLAVPAVAGAGALTGHACANACPLAKQANERRAPGTEAVRTSPVVRRDLVVELERNLAKI